MVLLDLPRCVHAWHHGDALVDVEPQGHLCLGAPVRVYLRAEFVWRVRVCVTLVDVEAVGLG